MDPSSTDKDGQTLLMYAAREGHIEVTQLLLDRKANPNARTAANESALMFAAYKGHVSTVKLLHRRGALVNKDGWTPLHYAAFQGHPEVVRYLLESGAEINAKAPNGATALMFAARGGHKWVVTLLLTKSADPNVETETGVTALKWALQTQNTEIAELLKKAGLLAAFRLVAEQEPNAELWLVGDGPQREALHHQVKRSLPPGRVRLLPGRLDLLPLFREASLLVLSSRWEGLPNVVLEAMAAGLPVVATRVGGLPEVVLPGQTGWLAPPRDPPALAAAINEALTDPATRRVFGRNARQRVKEKFSLADMARHHQKVFLNLLANQRGRPDF